MRHLFPAVLTIVALVLSAAHAFADDETPAQGAEPVVPAADDAASDQAVADHITANDAAAEQCVALTISKYSKYNLRAQPQSAADVVGKIDGKTKSVCFTEKTDNWLKIRYEDNDAYLCACVTDYSAPLPSKIRLVSKQRVYEQPSHTSLCEDELSEGTEVQPLAQKGCWYEINVSGVASQNGSNVIHGYIDSCDVTIVE